MCSTLTQAVSCVHNHVQWCAHSICTSHTRAVLQHRALCHTRVQCCFLSRPQGSRRSTALPFGGSPWSLGANGQQGERGRGESSRIACAHGPPSPCPLSCPPAPGALGGLICSCASFSWLLCLSGCGRSSICAALLEWATLAWRRSRLLAAPGRRGVLLGQQRGPRYKKPPPARVSWAHSTLSCCQRLPGLWGGPPRGGCRREPCSEPDT